MRGYSFIVAAALVAFIGLKTIKNKDRATQQVIAQPISYAGNYSDIIEQSANKYGVDPDLLTALVKQESNFNPNAVSSAGAMGLGQLMPGTANDMGVSDPFNPEQNLDGSAKYLSMMLSRYNSIELALAAYNAGPKSVDSCWCIPSNGETHRYVTNVMNYYRQAQR